jgi:hypothetical protein
LYRWRDASDGEMAHVRTGIAIMSCICRACSEFPEVTKVRPAPSAKQVSIQLMNEPAPLPRAGSKGLRP